MGAGTILSAAQPGAIRLAAETIRAGGLVAFPTETVYGLGCDVWNLRAIANLFEAKQRPRFDPLIVHVADREAVDALVPSLSAVDHSLMEAFWPGPLTLVLPKRAVVPDLATAGLPTVAVRMPAHPVARALIREAGCPIAAPSANPFGYVSPTTAQHVLDGLGDRVDLILDGGPCPIGVESTIVSTAGTWAELLRPGSIALTELRDVIGPMLRPYVPGSRSDAPGQSPRHYATRTPVTILAPGTSPVLQHRERAGLLAVAPLRQPALKYCVVEVLSPGGDLKEAARHLFAVLRRLDESALDRLYVEPCEEQGLGVAIMDRLRRCAAPLESHWVPPMTMEESVKVLPGLPT
jgi:L-threonylcarbamoyladenylate synthase